MPSCLDSIRIHVTYITMLSALRAASSNMQWSLMRIVRRPAHSSPEHCAARCSSWRCVGSQGLQEDLQGCLGLWYHLCWQLETNNGPSWQPKWDITKLCRFTRSAILRDLEKQGSCQVAKMQLLVNEGKATLLVVIRDQLHQILVRAPEYKHCMSDQVEPKPSCTSCARFKTCVMLVRTVISWSFSKLRFPEPRTTYMPSQL